ncbi:hypothetical protein D3C81_1726070 [compost metagenome]
MNAGYGNFQCRLSEDCTQFVDQAFFQQGVALRIRRADLCQQVECHLPIKKARLQWTHIQQLGGLPGQLGHRLAALGGHSQAGGQGHVLHIQQFAQRREHHCQGGGRGARAADLERFFQAGQHLGIGLRHHLGRLLGRQGS